MKNSAESSPLEILINRRNDGYQPGSDKDGHNIAIAVDGGGMACVVGLGMADVLKSEGLFDMADQVSGISGGALVAASAMTNQIELTRVAFEEELPRRDFINYKRKLKRQPIVDLPVLDNLIRRDTPLDIESLISNPQELRFGVTDVVNFKAKSVSSKSEPAEKMITWFMRGLHLPREAGKPVADEEDNIWADGGLSWQQTQDISLNNGATEVLNVTNAPKKLWSVDASFTTYVGKWLKRYGPDNLDKFRDFAHKQAASINSESRPNVQTIYPAYDAPLPGVLTTNEIVLKTGRVVGQNAARLAISGDSGYQHPEYHKKPSILSNLGNRALKTYFSLAP